MEVIPYVSVSPNKVCCYSRVIGFNAVRSEKQVENEKKLSVNDTSGEISKKARKKISSGIDWLLYLTSDKKAYSEKSGKYFSFKINFVTLTLSSLQMHSDQFIKAELLNQFLTECRKKWKTDKYLWRAEAQKNGNIHFHIIFNQFIPWHWIKSVWNRIQNKHGYVNRFAKLQHVKYKNGFFFQKNDKYNRSYKTQLKHYRGGISGDWFKPNSTDIHSIKNIENISSYLSKYCTKNDASLHLPIVVANSTRYYKASPPNATRMIEGRLWYLSVSLSKLKSAIEIIDYEISEELNTLALHFDNRLTYYQYCTVFYVNHSDLRKITSFALLSLLSEYYSGFKDN